MEKNKGKAAVGAFAPSLMTLRSTGDTPYVVTTHPAIPYQS
jgi:hypothetical protein